MRPTPPFGLKRVTTSEPARADSTARVSPTLRTIVVRSKPVNGIFRTASMPRSVSSLHRVLRHGEHDDPDLRLGAPDLLGDLLAAHAALEQRVDDHDVGMDLRHARRPPDRPP